MDIVVVEDDTTVANIAENWHSTRYHHRRPKQHSNTPPNELTENEVDLSHEGSATADGNESCERRAGVGGRYEERSSTPGAGRNKNNISTNTNSGTQRKSPASGAHEEGVSSEGNTNSSEQPDVDNELVAVVVAAACLAPSHSISADPTTDAANTKVDQAESNDKTSELVPAAPTLSTRNNNMSAPTNSSYYQLPSTNVLRHLLGQRTQVPPRTVTLDYQEGAQRRVKDGASGMSVTFIADAHGEGNALSAAGAAGQPSSQSSLSTMQVGKGHAARTILATQAPVVGIHGGGRLPSSAALAQSVAQSSEKDDDGDDEGAPSVALTAVFMAPDSSTSSSPTAEAATGEGSVFNNSAARGQSRPSIGHGVSGQGPTLVAGSVVPSRYLRRLRSQCDSKRELRELLIRFRESVTCIQTHATTHYHLWEEALYEIYSITGSTRSKVRARLPKRVWQKERERQRREAREAKRRERRANGEYLFHIEEEEERALQEAEEEENPPLPDVAEVEHASKLFERAIKRCNDLLEELATHMGGYTDRCIALMRMINCEVAAVDWLNSFEEMLEIFETKIPSFFNDSLLDFMGEVPATVLDSARLDIKQVSSFPLSNDKRARVMSGEAIPDGFPLSLKSQITHEFSLFKKQRDEQEEAAAKASSSSVGVDNTAEETARTKEEGLPVAASRQPHIINGNVNATSDPTTSNKNTKATQPSTAPPPTKSKGAKVPAKKASAPNNKTPAAPSQQAQRAAAASAETENMAATTADSKQTPTSTPAALSASQLPSGSRGGTNAGVAAAKAEKNEPVSAASRASSALVSNQPHHQATSLDAVAKSLPLSPLREAEGSTATYFTLRTGIVKSDLLSSVGVGGGGSAVGTKAAATSNTKMTNTSSITDLSATKSGKNLSRYPLYSSLLHKCEIVAACADHTDPVLRTLYFATSSGAVLSVPFSAIAGGIVLVKERERGEGGSVGGGENNNKGVSPSSPLLSHGDHGNTNRNSIPSDKTESFSKKVDFNQQEERDQVREALAHFLTSHPLPLPEPSWPTTATEKTFSSYLAFPSSESRAPSTTCTKEERSGSAEAHHQLHNYASSAGALGSIPRANSIVPAGGSDSAQQRKSNGAQKTTSSVSKQVGGSSSKKASTSSPSSKRDEAAKLQAAREAAAKEDFAEAQRQKSTQEKAYAAERLPIVVPPEYESLYAEQNRRLSEIQESAPEKAAAEEAEEANRQRETTMKKSRSGSTSAAKPKAATGPSTTLSRKSSSAGAIGGASGLTRKASIASSISDVSSLQRGGSSAAILISNNSGDKEAVFDPRRDEERTRRQVEEFMELKANGAVMMTLANTRGHTTTTCTAAAAAADAGGIVVPRVGNNINSTAIGMIGTGGIGDAVKWGASLSIPNNNTNSMSTNAPKDTSNNLSSGGGNGSSKTVVVSNNTNNISSSSNFLNGVRLFEGHTYSVHLLEYFPSLGMLVSASEDKTVRVHDAASGKLLNVIVEFNGLPSSVCHHRDMEALVIGTYAGELLFVEPRTKACVGKMQLAHPIHSLCFDAALSVLFVGTRRGHVYGFKLAIETVFYRPRLDPIYDEGKVQDCVYCFLPVAEAEAPRAYPTNSATCSLALQQEEGLAELYMKRANERAAGASSAEYTSHLQNAPNNASSFSAGTIKKKGFPSAAAGISSATSAITKMITAAFYLLVGDASGCVYQWDLASGDYVRKYHGHSDDITDLVLTVDGLLFSSSKDALIIVWSILDGGRLRVVNQHYKGVSRIFVGYLEDSQQHQHQHQQQRGQGQPNAANAPIRSQTNIDKSHHAASTSSAVAAVINGGQEGVGYNIFTQRRLHQGLGQIGSSTGNGSLSSSPTGTNTNTDGGRGKGEASIVNSQAEASRAPISRPFNMIKEYVDRPSGEGGGGGGDATNNNKLSSTLVDATGSTMGAAAVGASLLRGEGVPVGADARSLLGSRECVRVTARNPPILVTTSLDQTIATWTITYND